MLKRTYCNLEKDKSLLCSCIRLDYKVYEPKYRIKAYKYFNFFEKNNEAFIFIKDYEKNRLAGYLLVLPLTDEAYDTIKSGDVVDVSYLGKEHILPFIKGRNKLYISSIVVDPDYQGHGIGRQLLEHLFDDLTKKEEQGIITESILADTVSKGGYESLSSYGLELYKKSNHKSNTLERRHKTTIELTIEEYYNDTAPRERGFHKKSEEYRFLEEGINNKRKTRA